MPQEPYRVKIVNVVASITLGCSLNLNEFLALHGGEYNPKKFPGLVYRMTEPKAIALVFGSGKIVCIGTKSIPESKEVVQTMYKKLKTVGIELREEPKIKVENIVASYELPSKVNLDAAAQDLHMALYEPNEFPGLEWHIEDPKVTLLIFHTGKGICAGAKSEEDVHHALEKLHKELEMKKLYVE